MQAYSAKTSVVLVSIKNAYRDYCLVTKPGLVSFVVFSVYINYSFAVKSFALENILWPLLLGTYLAGSGAHVLNQYLEAKTDALMPRTSFRPFARGSLPRGWGLALGIAMAGSGVLLHGIFFPPLTAWITFATLALYLFAYTPLKKLTVWNTWVGAIPGALPSLTGFSATWHDLPLEAWILPLMIFFWQIPHFLALAFKYQKQYQAAGLLMFPSLDKSGKWVGILMLIHALMLVEVSAMLYFFDLVSWFSVIFCLFLGLGFLYSILGFIRKPDVKIAGKVFMASNFYLLFLYSWLLVEQYIQGYF